MNKLNVTNIDDAIQAHEENKLAIATIQQEQENLEDSIKTYLIDNQLLDYLSINWSRLKRGSRRK